MPFAIVLAFFCVSALAVVGWIANIVKLVGMLYDPFVTPMLLFRGLGVILPPIGAVLGFL